MVERQESKGKQLDLYKNGAERFISFFKVASILSLLIGGWGLFNYCAREGIPFPVDVPAMILTVGVVGAGLSLAVTVILFFPRLGIEGLLGDDYLRLFPKKKHTSKIFAGYVGIPTLIFFVVFLFDVVVESPMEEVADWLLLGVGLVIALISISVTAYCSQKKTDRLKFIILGGMLAFMVMAWSLLTLMLFVRLLGLLEMEGKELISWGILFALPVLILVILYKMMTPQGEETSKKWKVLMILVLLAPMVHPNLAGYMAGRSLVLVKGGGGYESSYALRREYCDGAFAGLCKVDNNKTVQLAVMLDIGDRIYVRPVETELGAKQKKLYAMPARAIIEQDLSLDINGSISNI
ncbi:MAG: hypothetical protein OQK78_03130 [Gammaproteobacteria bacterium]|nr:hypothetical protein [Gammaproteobacteria bacterium]